MRKVWSDRGCETSRPAPALISRRSPRGHRAGLRGLYAGCIGLALTALSIAPPGRPVLDGAHKYVSSVISQNVTGSISAPHARGFNAVYSEMIFGRPVYTSPIPASTFGAPIHSATLQAPAAVQAHVAPEAPAAATVAQQQVAVTPEISDISPQAVPLPPVNPFRNGNAGRTIVARVAPGAPAVNPQPVPAQQEEPGFFARIFGATSAPVDPQPNPLKRVTAYAPLNDDRANPLREMAPFRQNAPVEKTAVYVIKDRIVYMPDGTKLEAHSGLGPKMDDPRYTHVRMAGATPPNTYNLVMRERRFHGVEAIRMLPVDKGRMFGRDGILAHSYLLGPRGDSHGCVSFADYNKFLNAFKRGEVTRLVVVADGSSMLAMNARR